MLDRRLGADEVLLCRSRTRADAANDLAVDENRQTAADDTEVAAVGDMNAEGLVAGHAQLVLHVRPAPRDRAGSGLVHGDRDAT